MTALYLSRLCLRERPDIAPLKKILLPKDADTALASDHSLMWTVFQPSTEDQRRFLWRRQDAAGRYVTLSTAPPAPDSALFRVETRPFEPSLQPGDRLSFALRVNATINRRSGGRAGKAQRVDVAMDLLKPVAKAERAAQREELAAAGAEAWLNARAAGYGFELNALRLEGYRVARAPRGGGQAPAQFGVFDLEGLLTVADPPVFLARLATGFGRAKAFGCGLMLIRRAPA